LIIPEPKKKPKSGFICFAAEQPNEMWQTDFTHYRLTRPDGTPGADVEILSFLDDHSRYALSITCHQPVTGPAVVAAFRHTVAVQGILNRPGFVGGCVVYATSRSGVAVLACRW
jgi:hypothetical protein